MIAVPEISYLDLDDILAIHDEVMERTSLSSAPLRDQGLLEGAVMRPRNRAHYEDADLLTQACTLIIAISQAQAFADGNKRTAMQSGLMFLDNNGLTFTGDPVLLAVLIEESAEKPSQDEAITELIHWIRPYVAPLS